MASENFGCALFTLSAIILVMSSMNMFNKENFSEVEPSIVNPKFSTGPSLTTTMDMENYQNSIIMNSSTSNDDVNKTGARYYQNLQNYLAPSLDNLQLAQNIQSRPVVAGVPLPGADHFYKNNLGDGFVNNAGVLKGLGSFPTVNYSNDRAAQLSQCSKDLPMFAASSLLPKPSTNASDNALSQTAARALAAYTALSPVESLGAITSIKSPYSKTSDYRALYAIPETNMSTPMFNASPNLYAPTTYGQVINASGKLGASGLL
jgi:hypothetical protein